SNAVAVMIEPGSMSVPSSGSLTVSPAQSTYYQLTATNAAGENVSRGVGLTVSQPVHIDIDVPAEGGYAAGPLPYFHIEVISSGSTIIDASTLELFKGSEPLNANCTYNLAEHFGCRAVDPFAEGVATISARVANYDGVSSNLATRTFLVDSTAPAAPDISKISLSPPDQDSHVLVIGAPGAAEPGATV